MANVLYKGSEWRRRVVVSDEDGSRTNLDGKVLRLEVRRQPGAAVLITLTSGDGITHLDQNDAELEGCADIVISTALSGPLDAPTNHVLKVLLDGQVIVPPQFLEIHPD